MAAANRLPASAPGPGGGAKGPPPRLPAARRSLRFMTKLAQSCGELCRLILEHLWRFLDARRRLERDAVLARDHVDVEVEYYLSARGLVELLQRYTVGAEHIDADLGDTLGDRHHMGEVVGRDIKNI